MQRSKQFGMLSVMLYVLSTAEPALAQTGSIYEELMHAAQQAADAGKPIEAVEKLSLAIKAKPDAAAPYYQRGRELFRGGKAREAVADFNTYIARRPDHASRQWERGIALYYAGDFVEGAKQFELYQTFHNADVENAAWRYLCQVRASGEEKAEAIAAARKSILEIERDARVPMMEIYDLYRGKLSPDDVLAAAKADSPPAGELNARLFYAHLYIGLWHEVQGDAAKAREHIIAAEGRRIGHTMWDVAHVHADRLRDDARGQKTE